ncbi:MAG TPA: hypothetical protein VM118_06645 [Acidobacteriota bacterium]|nr:hypothetical protein [Acidobacteriota bacterium]
MFEPYLCPHCGKAAEIDLQRELEAGETDLRRSIDGRQNLKLDLPKRLLVICNHCGRQMVIHPSG